MAFPDSILRAGTRADQPAATDVAPGSLYSVTDEDYLVEQSDGVVWTTYAAAGTGGATGITALTGPVTASGTGSVASTLTPTGVGAGSYGSASQVPVLTVNAAGQLTGVTNTTIAGAAVTLVQSLGITIDGGGAVITTGVKGYLQVPFACTITGWTLLADVSGSAVVDVWKDTYANAPPVVGDTITAAAKPSISGAVKGQSATLTGWTTTVNAGDVLAFNVDSVATVTRITVQLTVTRTL
jgi:hypothetical protein